MGRHAPDLFFSGVPLMAIAGGAVPCAIMTLDRDWYFLFANGDVVEDNMERAFQRIINGEQVHVHRFALNVPTLRKRLDAYRLAQAGQGLRGDNPV